MSLDNVIKEILQKTWDNNEVYGTPIPINGSVGDNTITIKSGGHIDYDPGGKYLASVGVELESYAVGDYIKEIAITDGSTRIIVAKNISLAYSLAIVEFKTPRPVPLGFWIEIVITLSAAKGISVDTEFVW